MTTTPTPPDFSRDLGAIRTLAEGLPYEQERCRGILENALEIGPAGLFLVAMLRQSLKNAERAAASGNVAEMLAAYNDLKGYKE